MVERGPAQGDNRSAASLRQRYPTVDDLRRKARRRVPRFGFDFVDGGANEEYCVDRNIDAFQGIELLPRYCVEGKADTKVEIFGRQYSAPIGVAPMGSAFPLKMISDHQIFIERRSSLFCIASTSIRGCRIRGFTPSLRWPGRLWHWHCSDGISLT